MRSPKDWSEERRETLFAALLLACGSPPKSLSPNSNGLFRWNKAEDATYAMQIDTQIGKMHPGLRLRPEKLEPATYHVADGWLDASNIARKTPISMLRNAFLRWFAKQSTQLTHEPKQESITP